MAETFTPPFSEVSNPPTLYSSFLYNPTAITSSTLICFFFTFGIAHFGGQIGLLKWTLFPPTYTDTDLKGMEVLS